MSRLKDLALKAKGAIPINAKRSTEWNKVRKQHLIDNPICAACGETKKLEVHHIKPFHLYPELELDPDNLITLCETASKGIICHMCIGHRGNYKDWNPDVREDAKAISEFLTQEKDEIL